MKNSANTPWLAYFKPNPAARLRLFCFPYAGGNAVIYRTWANSLPPSVEVCPVQLPGRGHRLREEPHRNVHSMVEDVGQALLPYMDIPFAFWGHSMGGMLSYELAQLLRREARTAPVHLFISGRRAPHMPDVNPITYDLPEAEFIEELRRLKGTPPEILDSPELMQMVIPLLRADFQVCQTYSYSPQPSLDCPISVFGGLKDVEVSREYLEAWRDHTTSSFWIRMFPGDHFFLHTSQGDLFKILSQELHQLASRIGHRQFV